MRAHFGIAGDHFARGCAGWQKSGLSAGWAFRGLAGLTHPESAAPDKESVRQWRTVAREPPYGRPRHELPRNRSPGVRTCPQSSPGCGTPKQPSENTTANVNTTDSSTGVTSSVKRYARIFDGRWRHAPADPAIV